MNARACKAERIHDNYGMSFLLSRFFSRIGTHIGVLFLRLLVLLPNRTIQAIGKGLGRILFRFGRGRVTLINLRLCFPDKTEAEHVALAKAHFDALGRSAAELAILWFGSDERVLAMTRIEGLENLKALRKDNPKQPIIMLAPHFIGLNMGGAAIANYLGPVSSIYSRQKNPIVDALMLKGRLRFGQPILLSRQDGLKPAIRAIRDGLPFYYLPDMDFGARDSIFVPFFGVPAATVHALPRLAQLGRAKVVPMVSEQTETGYILRIYPALENFPSDNVEADVLRMNALIEDYVRPIIPQYLWSHKRFKTRPEGEPSPYK
jgi:Kdo2-lipid IVA lauroyltransferase/acyltransferase